MVWHSYPGAYVTDSDGIILEKFFENNFTVRPGPEQLLAALKGEQVDLIKKNGDDEQVKVEVAFEGDTLPAGITRQIVARFSVPEGMHLYGQPVPEGLVPASIQLDEELKGIVSYTPVGPKTRPLTLSGDGHTLEVYEGDVVLRLPVAQNGRAVEKDEDGRWVRIAGKVRWQACDDEKCDVPQEHPLFSVAGRLQLWLIWGLRRAHFDEWRQHFENDGATSNKLLNSLMHTTLCASDVNC